MLRKDFLFSKLMDPTRSCAAAANSPLPDVVRVGQMTMRIGNLSAPLPQRSRMLLNCALSAETLRQPLDGQADDSGLFSYTFLLADGTTMLATCALDRDGYLRQLVITDVQGHEQCDARMENPLR